MKKLGYLVLILVLIPLLYQGIAAGNVSVYRRVQTLIETKEKQSLLQAQDLLLELYKHDNTNVKTLCYLAEVHFHLGAVMPQEQIELWEQGEKYAQRAVQIEPNNASAHYWIGALLGRIGDAQGILKSLFLVNPVMHHLEKAIELDQTHSWAHFILSHVYAELPPRPLGRGDGKKALELARIAWELEPTEGDFVLQYAKLLIKQNRQSEAKKVLKAALQSSATRWTDALRSEAEELETKLKN